MVLSDVAEEPRSFVGTCRPSMTTLCRFTAAAAVIGTVEIYRLLLPKNELINKKAFTIQSVPHRDVSLGSFLRLQCNMTRKAVCLLLPR